MYYDMVISGKRIAQLRKDKRLSQAGLSEELNIHEKTISKAERGVNELSVDNLILMADYFGVSMEYLIGSSEDVDSQIIKIFNRCPEHRKDLLIKVMKTFCDEGA